MGKNKNIPAGNSDNNLATLESKLGKIKNLAESKDYLGAVNLVRLLFSESRVHFVTELTQSAKKTAHPQLGDLINEIYQNRPSLFSRDEPGIFYQKIDYQPKPEVKPEPEKVEVQISKTAAVKLQPDFNLPEAYFDFITRQNFSPDILKINTDRHPASDDLLTVRISGNSLYRYSLFFNRNVEDASLVALRLCNLLEQTFNLHTFRYIGGSSDYFPIEVNKKNFEAFKKALPSFYQTLQGLYKHFTRQVVHHQLSPNEKKKLLYEICLYVDMNMSEARPATVQEQPKPVPQLTPPEKPKPKEIDLRGYDSYLKEKGFELNQDHCQRKDVSFPLKLTFDYQNKTVQMLSENLLLLSSHFSEEQKKEFNKKFKDFFKNNFQSFNPQEGFNKTSGFYWVLKFTGKNFSGFAPALDNLLEKADFLYHHLHLYLSPGLADPVTLEKYQMSLDKFS